MKDLDLEEHPFFRDVSFCLPLHCIMFSRDQGGLDACYAFVVSSIIYVDLAVNQGGGVRPSEQLLVDCLHEVFPPKQAKERKPGKGYMNSIKNALQYTLERKLLLNQDYPWVGMLKNCSREDIFPDSFIVIDEYECLTSCEAVVEMLNKSCAVGASIFVTSVLYLWNNGIYTLDDAEKGKSKDATSGFHGGFHGITLIGHGKKDGISFFIAQNSWGQDWGFYGLFKVEQSCLKDFYCVRGSKVKEVKLSTKDAAKKNSKIKNITGLPQQTDPPSVAVSELFPSGMFPKGVIEQYKAKGSNFSRTIPEEKRELELQKIPVYNSFRQAAEVHRQVRNFIRQNLEHGMLVAELCNSVEDSVRKLLAENGLNDGIAYPTGCLLNGVAANWTPNSDDKTVIKYDDVMKLDFGMHVDGNIVSSAFTVAFNSMFDPLLEISREATNVGIKEAGVDVRLCDVGAAIEEYVESKEDVVINGKKLKVKLVKNLLGHSMGPYQLYAGKSVHMGRGDQTKMEEGECYVIKPFVSTGAGVLKEDGVCNLYKMKINAPHVKPKGDAKKLLSTIDNNFSTLPFCKRYLDRLGEKNYSTKLKSLCNTGFIEALPRVCYNKDNYMSVYGHTILLRPTCKEVVTRVDGYDY